MENQTKGKCKYCGKEYTRAYMLRHLDSCKKRKERIAAETGTKKCGYFELVISGKYEKEYWLVIEIGENVTLKDLDSFLRDIWVECCGHLSTFNIYGVSYTVEPAVSSMWGQTDKSMNYKLKSVLEKGMSIGYRNSYAMNAIRKQPPLSARNVCMKGVDCYVATAGKPMNAGKRCS